MELSQQQLLLLHRNLGSRVSQCLGYQVSVSAAEAGWKRAAQGAIVVFELFSPVYTDRAERCRGHYCHVVPVFQNLQYEPTAWTSWHEEWMSRGDGDLGFVAAAWTYYWGTYARDKTQLFRAEWDTLDRPRGQAAQPHWHIDRKLLEIVSPALAAREGGASEQGALVELETDRSVDALEELGAGLPSLSSEALQELDLAHLHLGMGGWDHPGTTPDCWRRSVRTANDIVDWADNALRLSMSELTRLRNGATLWQ